MPGKGLEKGGGVPPSPRLWRDKLSQGKRTDPAKGLFPLLKYRPLLGTEQKLKPAGFPCGHYYNNLNGDDRPDAAAVPAGDADDDTAAAEAALSPLPDEPPQARV